jgi:hypothetical protein
VRALEQCRLEDIGRFDRVKVECQCGRTVLLPSSIFNGLPNDLLVLDLRGRLRCDSCGEKGKVMCRWCGRPTHRVEVSAFPSSMLLQPQRWRRANTKEPMRAQSVASTNTHALADVFAVDHIARSRRSWRIWRLLRRPELHFARDGVASPHIARLRLGAQPIRSAPVDLGAPRRLKFRF